MNESNLEVLTLTVTLNAENEPQYNYSKNDLPATGSVVVSGAKTIRYYLIDKTEKGLNFVNVAFATPFDGIIDQVKLGTDGDNRQYIDLIDSDAIAGKTGFSFVLSNTENSLMLLSPDPQVVNSGPY